MIESYLLKDGDLSFTILNYGATIADICFQNRHIALRFKHLDNYRKRELNPFLGSTVGRFSNRIENGTVFLNNQLYELDKNENGNYLHGGFNGGFAFQFWQLIKHESNHLILELRSPHLDQKLPGSLIVTADFQIQKGNILDIFYSAMLDDTNPADLQTVVNLTNHVYFNLNGVTAADDDEEDGKLNLPILNHELYSRNAKAVLEQNKCQIPTKRLIELDNADSPLQIHKQFLKLADGCAKDYYDHSFVFETNPANYTANSIDYSKCNRIDNSIELICKESGIKVELLTNNPSCHVYTGPRDQLLNYPALAGVCLEAQSFVNCCNVPEWQNQCLITKDRPYSKNIFYRFSEV